MAVMVGGCNRRGAVLHDVLQIRERDDLLIDCRTMVVGVRQGIVPFCRMQMGERTEDLLYRQSTAIALHNRADRKPAAFHYWPPSLHVRTSFNIWMDHLGRYWLRVHAEASLVGYPRLRKTPCLGVRRSRWTYRPSTAKRERLYHQRHVSPPGRGPFDPPQIMPTRLTKPWPLADRRCQSPR
jgi:hypothetical protein